MHRETSDEKTEFIPRYLNHVMPRSSEHLYIPCNFADCWSDEGTGGVKLVKVRGVLFFQLLMVLSPSLCFTSACLISVGKTPFPGAAGSASRTSDFRIKASTLSYSQAGCSGSLGKRDDFSCHRGFNAGYIFRRPKHECVDNKFITVHGLNMETLSPSAMISSAW